MKDLIGRGVRACALGVVLALVFAGGLSVALDLERMILSGTELTDIAAPTRSTGFAFPLQEVFVCGGAPMPPFELGVFIVGPLLLSMAVPAPRTIELRLDA
jgi:hypothetical protein